MLIRRLPDGAEQMKGQVDRNFNSASCASTSTQFLHFLCIQTHLAAAAFDFLFVVPPSV